MEKTKTPRRHSQSKNYLLREERDSKKSGDESDGKSGKRRIKSNNSTAEREKSITHEPVKIPKRKVRKPQDEARAEHSDKSQLLYSDDENDIPGNGKRDRNSVQFDHPGDTSKEETPRKNAELTSSTDKPVKKTGKRRSSYPFILKSRKSGKKRLSQDLQADEKEMRDRDTLVLVASDEAASVSHTSSDEKKRKSGFKLFVERIWDSKPKSRNRKVDQKNEPPEIISILNEPGKLVGEEMAPLEHDRFPSNTSFNLSASLITFSKGSSIVEGAQENTRSSLLNGDIERKIDTADSAGVLIHGDVPFGSLNDDSLGASSTDSQIKEESQKKEVEEKKEEPEEDLGKPISNEGGKELPVVPLIEITKPISDLSFAPRNIRKRRETRRNTTSFDHSILRKAMRIDQPSSDDILVNPSVKQLQKLPIRSIWPDLSRMNSNLLDQQFLPKIPREAQRFIAHSLSKETNRVDQNFGELLISECLLDRGRQLITSEQIVEAIQHLSQCLCSLKFMENHLEINKFQRAQIIASFSHFYLAECHFKLMNYFDAEINARECLDILDDLLISYFEKCSENLKKEEDYGNMKDAENYKSPSQLINNSKYIWMHRADIEYVIGSIFWKESQYQDALNWFRRSLHSKKYGGMTIPSSSWCNLSLAYMHMIFALGNELREKIVLLGTAKQFNSNANASNIIDEISLSVEKGKYYSRKACKLAEKEKDESVALQCKNILITIYQQEAYIDELILYIGGKHTHQPTILGSLSSMKRQQKVEKLKRQIKNLQKQMTKETNR